MNSSATASDRSDAGFDPQQLTAAERQTWLWALAQLYVAGAELDWPALWPSPVPCRNSHPPLPTYPFQHSRHWPQFTTPTSQSAATVSQPKPLATGPVDEWLYRYTWQPSAAPVGDAQPDAGPWLVFDDESELSAALCARLRDQGAVVHRVRRGKRFTHRSRAEWTIHPDRSQQYQRLWNKLSQTGPSPRHVVHFWAGHAARRGAESRYELASGVGDGVRSALLMLRTMARAGLADQVATAFITGQAQAVREQDAAEIVPERAAVWGLSQCAAREEPRLPCRAIDVVAADASWPQLAEALLEDLVSGQEAEVAYRGLERWTPHWPRVQAQPHRRSSQRTITRGGVYLVTGGLSGVGQALAERWAKGRRAKVVLLGRRPLPPESDWDAWLATYPEHDPARQAIELVRRLRQLGGQAEYLRCDVAEAEDLAEAVADVRRRYGRLDGVIHAAGVYEDAPLVQKSLRSLERVLRPKVWGGWSLEQALSGDANTRVVLFSSIAGYAGGPGQTDYAAANRYLDALAAQRHGAGQPWTSVAWGLWGETDAGQRALRAGSTGVLLPMASTAALDALEQALALNLPNVIVAALRPEVTDAVVPQPPAEKRPSTDVGLTAEAPQSPAAAPLTATTASDDARAAALRYLTERLGKLLEVAPAELDLEARFLNLGMDSIVVVQFTRELEQQIGRGLPFTLLRDYPTISKLADFLAGEGKPQRHEEHKGVHKDGGQDLTTETQRHGENY